ncbi:S66 peptidase family protein [Verminephrobacter aporrectodeae]|nr:S66 peptidase family protein [Verminephrobacter aporrectodeae]
MSNYLRPPALKPGDQVGIIAPSFPSAVWFPRRLAVSLDALRTQLSVQPVLAEHVYKAQTYVSGPINERAIELQKFLESPSISAVFTTLGGFNSNELLPYLDFQTLKNKPKIFVGYSDTTLLQLALTSTCRWVTFSGPALLPQFGEYPEAQPFTVNNLKAILMGDCSDMDLLDAPQRTHEFLDWSADEAYSRARQMQFNPGRQVWRKGQARAPLFGGNIETINFLIGTPWLQWPDEFILFVEATEAEATLPRIQRALVHLKQCGVFERVRGFLFGQCPDACQTAGQTLEEMVLQVLQEYEFPIVAELSFGHSDPMLTLPNGCMANIQADQDQARVTLLESAVDLSVANAAPCAGPAAALEKAVPI